MDDETCSCVCAEGYGDCDGDPTNGCETRLNTVDNCLGCGISCDDGNACTKNTCDSQAGCQTANIDDGTPCGTGGSCASGACVSCVPSGTCTADADCCDDEFCCSGACTAKSALLDDVENCGACGVVCSAAACQTAICVDGACQSEPVADGDSCDDGNACTDGDHCMAGVCMGNTVKNGTPCDGGTCEEGTCAVCTPGISCEADGDCCDGEECCQGHCLALAGYGTDIKNCGGCGNVCESEERCLEVTCQDGTCGTTALPDDTTCGEDNPCLQNAVCLDGACTGDQVADGTQCNTDGTCKAGQCADPDVRAAAVTGPIFSDDFESGTMEAWTSTKGITIQTDVVATGKYAARATGAKSAGFARARLNPGLNELYLVANVQIIAQGDNSITLMQVVDSASGWSPILSVLINKSGKLSTYNNVSRETTASSTAFRPGTWYELQARFKVSGASSVVEIWLDGSKVADLSKTTNLGTAGVTTLQIGDNASTRTFDIAFDNVAVCVEGRCPSPGVSEPSEQPSAATSTAPGSSSSVLLSTYTHNSSAGVNWAKVAYRPRQFKNGFVVNDPSRGALQIDNTKEYENWDLLPTYNYGLHRVETRADWTVLELNRAATVAIVWRAGGVVPSWLSSWTKSENVVIAGKNFPTYRKKFSAGSVQLGAVYAPGDNPGGVTRDTYLVLLAETDGLSSPAPSVPSGMETPVPNTTCPAWVHDRYVATGPDGLTYPTWHALIDPVYWCYHRHEHGSNPVHFASNKKPVFGYTAAKHGMSEPHAGFKNFVFDSDDGTRWMVTHHFGTAGLARACGRFHTVDIAVRNRASGELLVDLHLMGDFGKSVINGTHEVLTPPTCPDQAKLAADSTGVRMLPAKSAGSVGYEPWRVDLRKTILGLVSDFTVNDTDSIVICNNAICDQPVSTGNTGTKRFFTPNRNRFGKNFGVKAGNNTGVFYTNPYGTEIVGSSDPGAVKQFVKPDIDVTHEFQGGAGHCFDVDAWGKLYVCGATNSAPTDREGSAKPPN